MFKGMDRGSLIGAIFLIGLGALFLVFNLVPNVSFSTSWPIILFVAAAGLGLPAWVWPAARRGLATLFIPACILLLLGLIFLYNVLSGDWAAWAYAWLLIPMGIGLGLLVGTWIGGWESNVAEAGIWIMILNGAAFGLFSTLFGAPLLKIIGAVALLVGGGLLLLRGFLKGRAEA
jgi:hypothetical protein